MLTKSDIDKFLLEPSNNASHKSTRYEYMQKMARKFNGSKADDALSHLIEYLYTREFEFVSESLCITVLKNFQFYNSRERTYQSKFTELADYESIETSSINELTEEAERATNGLNYKTFYATELAIEGKLTDEEIDQLERLRAASAKLPLWASRLYQLHLIEGKTMRQIAEQFGMPTTSIFLKIKKMKEILHEELKKAEKLW